MAKLRSPIFIICIVLFIIHQIMQKGFGLHISLLDNYLDNLLAMPIILTLLLAERTWLFKKGKNYRLSKMEIVMTTLYISIISEILFPLLSNYYKGDWVDVVFYSIGSVLFYFTTNKVVERKKFKCL